MTTFLWLSWVGDNITADNISDTESELRAWAVWESKGARTQVQAADTIPIARTPTRSPRSGLAVKTGSWTILRLCFILTVPQAGQVQEVLRPRSEAAELQLQLRPVQPGHVRRGPALVGLPWLRGRHLVELSSFASSNFYSIKTEWKIISNQGWTWPPQPGSTPRPSLPNPACCTLSMEPGNPTRSTAGMELFR